MSPRQATSAVPPMIFFHFQPYDYCMSQTYMNTVSVIYTLKYINIRVIILHFFRIT